MDKYILFGKFIEHEIEQKRIVDDEKGDKDKNILAPKAEYSNFDKDMSFMVKNFRRFMKYEKQQEEQNINERRSPFTPTCFQCGKRLDNLNKFEK